MLKIPDGVKASIRNRGGKIYITLRGEKMDYRYLRRIVSSVFPIAAGTSGGRGSITMRLNPENHDTYLFINFGRKHPNYTLDENGVGIVDSL